MDWPKVKTILIVVLLAVNLFLLGAYSASNLKQSHNQEQVRREVCEVLNGLGYKLDISILPPDSEMYYPARITRRTKSEQQTISQALQDTQVENAVGMTRYTGKNGSVTLRSGGYFDAEFRLFGENSDEPLKVAAAKLRDIRVNIVSADVRTEGAIQVVGGTCVAAGKPIFNCRVECRISGNSMAVSGRTPMGDMSFLQSIRPFAVSGLMLNFAQHMKSIGVESGTVQEIAPGYIAISPSEVESGVTELAPVWRIRMDGEDYYINALNGKAVTPD